MIQTDTSYLADHTLLLALPAFIPAVIVAGVVVYIAMKDRRKGPDPEPNTDEDKT